MQLQKTSHELLLYPTLRYLISELDLLSEQGGMFSEFNSNELGGIFHLLHEFASRVENCSEIIKQACSFKYRTHTIITHGLYIFTPFLY